MLDIGARIKKLREERRLTGKDLAQKIGLSQSQMSRLEKGLRRIDTEVLARVAEALGVPPSDFFVSLEETGDDPLTARRERELQISHLHVELGKTVRSARRQKHLTVEDLARKTDHTRAYVAAVEEGRRDGLEGEFLRKACRVLGLDPFGFVEELQRIVRDLKVRVHRLDRRLASSSETASAGAGIPLLVGEESPYPSEFDADGAPMAAVESYFELPMDVEAPAFAVRVHGPDMVGGEAPHFVEGDVVVFSRARAARSGEPAFVRLAGNETLFRILYQDDPRLFRLQAKRPEVPPLLIPAPDLKSAWPLVAHVSFPGSGAGFHER